MRNPIPIAVISVFVSTMLICSGCTSPQRLSMQAERYHLEVHLDPIHHAIDGLATIDLVRDREPTKYASLTDEPPRGESKPVVVELLLHPDLEIRGIRAAGGVVKRTLRPRQTHHGDLPPTRHRFVLEQAVDRMTLFVRFGGMLYQDPKEGEVSGQIHNVKMQASIATDGIYLGGAYWYPEPVSNDGVPPRPTDFTLLANKLDGITLVAGGDEDPEHAIEGKVLAWRSPFPLDGMVLVGGPHEVHHGEHQGTAIELHLKPGQAKYADGLMAAVQRNLDRYEPLIGKYPAKDFRIVDNFFSSGFAFPTFTLLSSAVINMGERSQTAHGYIDHEMLHSWWGNGVLVDPRDGNWCEALTSYCTNYYGYVLDGRLDEARRKRRNFCHFLSRLKPKQDKPLGTYGQKNGCGRGIAYNKGAAVFHMLAQVIGQDHFFEAMRTLTRERVGTYTSWDDIRKTCEHASGLSLEMFFRQWVRSGGAPSLAIESARYDSSNRTLSMELVQGEPAFALTTTVRITHADGSLDIHVPMDQPSAVVTVPVGVVPLTVEVDPDYDVFRKVPIDDLIPTTATTRQGDKFVSVVPSGTVPDAYAELRDDFAESFKDGESVALVGGDDEPGSLDANVLASGSVLLLGNAVRDEHVASFLTEMAFPITWTADGFVFDGVSYTDDGDAVLCTAHHPTVSGAGVTVVFGNSESAIPKAMIIPFYEHSVVIFKNRKPTVRQDLEHRRIVEVDQS